MQAEAESGPNNARCVEGEAVFYMSYPRALIPGHIYSELGLTEFRKLSRLCEYHFDQYTLVTEEQ